MLLQGCYSVTWVSHGCHMGVTWVTGMPHGCVLRGCHMGVTGVTLLTVISVFLVSSIIYICCKQFCRCAAGYHGGNVKNPVELLGSGDKEMPAMLEDIKTLCADDAVVYCFLRVVSMHANISISASGIMIEIVATVKYHKQPFWY